MSPSQNRRVAPVLLLVLTITFSLPASPSLTVNRTIWVPATGTPEQNCAALLTVIAGLGPTSETAAYLLKLQPGKYDCGVSSVGVPSFVQIEGAGQGVTLITSSFDLLATGVIEFEGVANTGLSHLSVVHPGGGDDAGGVLVHESDVLLDHVRVVTGATSFSSNGVLVSTNLGSLDEAKVVIRDSAIQGASDAIITTEAGASVSALAVSTSLAGGVNSGGGGTIKCVGSYIPGPTLLDSNCN